MFFLHARWEFCYDEQSNSVASFYLFGVNVIYFLEIYT